MNYLVDVSRRGQHVALISTPSTRFVEFIENALQGSDYQMVASQISSSPHEPKSPQPPIKPGKTS